MASIFYRAVLLSTEELSPTVRSFHLRVAGEERFSHRPGQWISVKIPAPEGIEERAYSIASPPRPDSTLELCARRISDGLAGSYFWSLKTGTAVEFSGPFGEFLLQEPLERGLVFIANGTGITPLRPMIQQALRDTNRYQATLLFGVRDEAELLYRSEWEALRERHRNFHFVPTLSRPEPSWRGRTGYVQENTEALLRAARDVDVYLCGLPEMVSAVRAQCREWGIPRDRVHFERHG